MNEKHLMEFFIRFLRNLQSWNLWKIHTQIYLFIYQYDDSHQIEQVEYKTKNKSNWVLSEGIIRSFYAIHFFMLPQLLIAHKILVAATLEIEIWEEKEEEINEMVCSNNRMTVKDKTSSQSIEFPTLFCLECCLLVFPHEERRLSMFYKLDESHLGVWWMMNELKNMIILAEVPKIHWKEKISILTWEIIKSITTRREGLLNFLRSLHS